VIAKEIGHHAGVQRLYQLRIGQPRAEAVLLYHFAFAGPQAQRQQPETGAFWHARRGDRTHHQHMMVFAYHALLLLGGQGAAAIMELLLVRFVNRHHAAPGVLRGVTGDIRLRHDFLRLY